MNSHLALNRLLLKSSNLLVRIGNNEVYAEASFMCSNGRHEREDMSEDVSYFGI